MFDNVLGHDNIKEKLKKDLKNDTLSHAYLFSGTEGIGKKMLALEFAKEILKTNKLETCVDFKLIQKQEDKKDILVEQIRDKIINDVYVAPATGLYKVYIIDEAEKLNLNAQNALLKTLEEPPKHTVIILVTNDDKTLLSTVISRVKKMVFHKLDDSQIILKLKQLNKEITDEKLEYVNGSLKHAIDICAQDENNKYNKIEELNLAIITKDMLKLMKIIADISFKDEETFNYLNFLLMKGRHYTKVEIVEKARLRMKQNANEDMVKQAFCINIIK